MSPVDLHVEHGFAIGALGADGERGGAGEGLHDLIDLQVTGENPGMASLRVDWMVGRNSQNFVRPTIKRQIPDDRVAMLDLAGDDVHPWQRVA